MKWDETMFFKLMIHGAEKESEWRIIDEDKSIIYAFHDGEVLPIPKIFIRFIIRFYSHIMDDLLIEMGI